MDFSITEKQIAYKKSVIEFAKKELNNDIYENDKQGHFSTYSWNKCAKMGYMGLLIPEKYEGIEENLLTTVLVIEALSYGCMDNGLIHAIVTQICCGSLLLIYGNEYQRQKYLKSISTGSKIAAQAMTESDAGSDLFRMKTNAVKNENKYTLNGNKLYISNGPIADICFVFALTNTDKKNFGNISCFMLEKNSKGFSSSPALEKLGLRTLQNSELIFQNCVVPNENRIGKDGQGIFIFNEIIEWERILMAACHLGTMQRIYDTCVSYAKMRKQFDKPIGKFQSVSNKIAQMKINIETGKLILYKSAWLKDQKKRATLETSIAKLFISENMKNICLEAVQIHGAYGYMKEAYIEKDLRDSIAATIYSGTSEMQKNLIATLVGL